MTGFRSRWSSWTPPAGTAKTDETLKDGSSVSFGGSERGGVLSNEYRRSPLTAEASRQSSTVRFTLRETADIEGDIRLLRNIRAVIEEYEHLDGHRGANHVDMTVIISDGTKRRLRWYAYASPELRRGISRLLAAAAVERRQVGRRPQ